jgi:uncharacterized protein (TIGR02246 family)
MRNVISLAIVLSLSSMSMAADNAAQAKAHKDVQMLLAKMANAEKSGDVSTLSGCFEGDGMLLPSSGEPVRGREGIAKRYQAIFVGNMPRLPLESEELWVLDDWAVSRGVTRAASAKKGVKGAVRNRYVMTLKRHGDAWEIQSLVWNSAAAAK